jgi:hypothetical protein
MLPSRRPAPQFDPTDTAAVDWIPPIPGLHRRDPEHQYWLGDHRFPVSVTGVLAASKSQHALQRIESKRDQWEQRGNDCHRAMELRALYERNGGDSELVSAVSAAGAEAEQLKQQLFQLQKLADGPWAAWIAPLISHQRWQEINVISAERPTCCLSRNVAGTFDLAYLDPQIPPSPLRPPHVTGPARVLADLKTLAPNRILWRSHPGNSWELLAEVTAPVAEVRLGGGGASVENRHHHQRTWRPLSPSDVARGELPATAPWNVCRAAEVELRLTTPSTYSTAAQGGGYMALEATHGHWYDWHQSIWARPGRCTWGPLIGVDECRWAWAEAWATYRATPQPLF